MGKIKFHFVRRFLKNWKFYVRKVGKIFEYFLPRFAWDAVLGLEEVVSPYITNQEKTNGLSRSYRSDYRLLNNELFRGESRFTAEIAPIFATWVSYRILCSIEWHYFQPRLSIKRNLKLRNHWLFSKNEIKRIRTTILFGNCAGFEKDYVGQSIEFIDMSKS